MFQMFFSYGLLVLDVTGVEWYDTDKVRGALLACSQAPGDYVLSEIAPFCSFQAPFSLLCDNFDVEL